MAASQLPESMLACQVAEYKKPYKIHKVSVPKDKLTEHDLLIKVAVASLCHTDFMVLNGEFGTPLPCTGSHEGAGVVEATGSAVKNFTVGDKVMAGLTYHSCNQCADCKGPDTQYCTGNKINGVNGVDGFFAEYAIVDSRSTTKMPAGVKFEDAAPLACAGRTIYRAIKQTGAQKGDWIAIVGSGGGLGHLGVQFAKALGLHVAGVETKDSGLDLTKKYGADLVLDARNGIEKAVEEVKKVTDGDGVRSAINLSDPDEAAAMACAVTRMHGIMVQVSQPETVSVPFKEIIFRDIKIHGSLVCNPQESAEMLEVASKHGVKVTTHAVNGLKEVPTIVDMSHEGKLLGKGIVIVDQDLVDTQ